jgi:hypothetical protein
MSRRFPFPIDHVRTAYATDEETILPMLGQEFTCDPVEVMQTVSITAGGAKEWFDAGVEGALGEWVISPYRCFNSITAGFFVTQAYEALTVTGTPTTTTVDGTLVINTANIWQNGEMTLESDVAGGGTEGSTHRIVSNTTTQVVFEPASVAMVATDIVTLKHYGGIMAIDANFQSSVGIALIAGTVGQYIWVLRKGYYPRLIIADPAATVVSGTPLTTNSTGNGLIALEVDSTGHYKPIVGTFAQARHDDNESLVTPANINCL